VRVNFRLLYVKRTTELLKYEVKFQDGWLTERQYTDTVHILY
jgi:hypothetical protein